MMIELDLAALNGRLFATFDPDNTQIVVDNQPDEDFDDTQVWMDWTIEPGSQRRVQNGINPVYEQLGTATLQIHVPQGAYTGPGDDVQKRFEDAFRDWRSDDRALRVYRIASSKLRNADNFQMNVTVFWESHRSP
jgi:hypothetical protein